MSCLQGDPKNLLTHFQFVKLFRKWQTGLLKNLKVCAFDFGVVRCLTCLFCIFAPIVFLPNKRS